MSSSSFSGSGSHYSSYNGSYSSVDFEKDKYTIKNAHAGQNKGLRYGTASMQGRRDEMEDAHNAILDFRLSKKPDEFSLFAVYDGHGDNGEEMALLCAAEIPKRIHRKASGKKVTLQAISEGMEDAFLDLDRDLIDDKFDLGIHPGSTAVVCVINNSHVVTGWAGDSRAVMSRKGRAVALTSDHKPDMPGEKQRINDAGLVVEDDRVDGLAMSRSIGDTELKLNPKLDQLRQPVIAMPDITVVRLDRHVEFIVIACDGIWDVMTHDEVISFVRRALKKDSRANLSDICASLIVHCLEIGSTDNMSVVIVQFRQKRLRDGSMAISSTSRPLAASTAMENRQKAEKSKGRGSAGGRSHGSGHGKGKTTRRAGKKKRAASSSSSSSSS